MLRAIDTPNSEGAGGPLNLPQADDLTKPLWDSGARDALHQAAQDEDLDFPGPGPRR